MERREIPGGVRFVTFSCYQRLTLLSNPRIADLFADQLRDICKLHDVRLLAWVVMPEHVHLLIIPSTRFPLFKSLSLMKQRVAQRVLGSWRRQIESNAARSMLGRVRDDRGEHRFWQRGGGFDRNVRDESELMKTINYIHRNPVKRGLVDEPDQWRWSSVRWWMGKHEEEVPCHVPEELALWKGFV
jgi:putative transposase